MTYTNERPTTTGFYWWRKNRYKATIMFYVWMYGDEYHCRRCGISLEDKQKVLEVPDGEWYGPLEVPE